MVQDANLVDRGPPRGADRPDADRVPAAPQGEAALLRLRGGDPAGRTRLLLPSDPPDPPFNPWARRYWLSHGKHDVGRAPRRFLWLRSWFFRVAHSDDLSLRRALEAHRTIPQRCYTQMQRNTLNPHPIQDYSPSPRPRPGSPHGPELATRRWGKRGLAPARGESPIYSAINWRALTLF